jgi:hypothetical protein
MHPDDIPGRSFHAPSLPGRGKPDCMARLSTNAIMPGSHADFKTIATIPTEWHGRWWPPFMAIASILIPNVAGAVIDSS